MKKNDLNNPIMRFVSFEDISQAVQSNNITPADHVVANCNFIITLGSKLSGNSDFMQATPNRMHCLKVLIIKSGSICPVVNMQEYRLEAGDLIYMNWGAVTDAVSRKDYAVVQGFAITEEFARSVLGVQRPLIFRNATQTLKLSVTMHEQQILHNYLAIILNLTTIVRDPDSNIYKCLFASLFFFIQTIYNRDANGDVKLESSSKSHLAALFTLMTYEHSKKRTKLEYYAAQLCVTPHYLSTVVKEETGETAKTWLDRALIHNIKLELAYSNKPLKNIAYDFGFESLSTFCKFFKRHTGITANTYRKK
ncbi:MAG: AraC family transcriptional regulator [Prevotella sp.]|nr:AraC family transcriptional regulator [Prevotella sp.]